MKRQALKRGRNFKHFGSLILTVGLLVTLVLGCNFSSWDAEEACNYLTESGLPTKKHWNINEAQICQGIGKLGEDGRVNSDPNLSANPNADWILLDMKDSQEKIIFYSTIGDKNSAKEAKLYIKYPKNADSKVAKETFVRLSDEIFRKMFDTPLPDDIKGKILSNKDIIHDMKINKKTVRFGSGNSGLDAWKGNRDCQPGKPCVIHDEFTTHKIYRLEILKES